MKDNLTDITIVLDRSISMKGLRKETLQGFNSFLADQQAVPGEATLTVVQFATEYQTTFRGKALKDVKPFGDNDYDPTGSGTAFLDSLARTINETGARLAALPEAERPGKVLVLVMTDGEDNTSRKFDLETVKQMVEHQTNVYKWTFVFAGANMDAVTVGGAFGTANAANFTASAVGTQNAYENLSRGVTRLRNADAAQYAAITTGNFYGGVQDISNFVPPIANVTPVTPPSSDSNSK